MQRDDVVIVIVGKLRIVAELNWCRTRDIESIDKESVMLSKQIKSFVKKVLSEKKAERQTQEETVVRRPKKTRKGNRRID